MWSAINELGIDFIKDKYIYFNQYYSYQFISIMLIIFLVFWAKGKKAFTTVFVYPALFCLLTVFNPFFYSYFIVKFAISFRYYRYFWMIPAAIVIAYAGVYWLRNIKEKKTKIIIMALMVLLVIGSGRSPFNLHIRAENIYKIKNESVEISEIIHEDSEDNVPLILVDYDILIDLWQYDAKFRSVLRRNEYSYISYNYADEQVQQTVLESDNYRQILAMTLLSGVQIDPAVFQQGIEKLAVDYIIQNKALDLQSYLEGCGYKVYKETENYLVYQVKHE